MLILLLEDEKEIRDLILGFLKKELPVETEFIETDNGDEALQLLRSRKFDLLITDNLHPGYSGDEITEFVRKDKTLSDLKIFMITLPDSVRFMLNKDSSLDAYMEKPFDIGEFVNVVKKLLS